MDLKTKAWFDQYDAHVTASIRRHGRFIQSEATFVLDPDARAPVTTTHRVHTRSVCSGSTPGAADLRR